MTSPIRIWTCAAYLPAYRCGGWAFVRVGQGQASGAAGGERHTTASRIALAGLASALRDLPPISEQPLADPIRIETTNRELAGFAGFLAGLSGATQPAAPDEDLDLWARIATAANGCRLNLFQTLLDPRAPSAFAAAWADLAREQAEASGAFSSAIPKPNLAKIQGLES